MQINFQTKRVITVGDFKWQRYGIISFDQLFENMELQRKKWTKKWTKRSKRQIYMCLGFVLRWRPPGTLQYQAFLLYAQFYTQFSQTKSWCSTVCGKARIEIPWDIRAAKASGQFNREPSLIQPKLLISSPMLTLSCITWPFGIKYVSHALGSTGFIKWIIRTSADCWVSRGKDTVIPWGGG